jgi:radical SAM protein (TIGR04043 family)
MNTTSSLPIASSAPAPSLPITPRLVELKAKIFCHGLRVPDDIWSEIADENHYKHKRAGVSQGRFFRLRDGLSYTTVNAPVLEPFVRRSPLHLVREGARYRIHENDVPLTDCEPFPWPRWYGKTTSAGVPMALVVSAHSATSLYTAIYQGGCDYFHGAQECQFCSMKIDNKTEWRKIEPIIEVAKAALEENPAAELSFGGGTRLTPDKGAKHDIAAIRAFKKEVDMPVCVEMAPPDTDDWLDELKDAGCESMMLNLEVWDRGARERLMPGKSKIPRERYLEALAYAVKLFGVHQVSSQVLIGLEPIESTLEGMAALADVGAIPLPTVFRPLNNTPLVRHETPRVEDVLRVFSANIEMLHTRGLLAEKTRAGCALCGACSSHR